MDSKGQPVAAATVRVDSIWIPKAEDLTPFLLAMRSGEDYDIAVLEMMDRVVRMGETMGSAITESDGTFHLPGGIRQEHLAMVRISLSRTSSASGCLFARGPARCSAPHIVESPNRENFRFFGSTFDFTARPSIPIAGLVRDQVTGQPVPGISVRFMANGRDPESDDGTRSDRCSGRYRMKRGGIASSEHRWAQTIRYLPRFSWATLFAGCSADKSCTRM